ncbi:MAG: ribosome small subunit-dependent GTPase A [Bacteroidetes bacterium CG2_30_32_10]|nr:MAG: ribosome small subunit-dependent GTPase A [Bacteroidetes bacterium CG2_30_32_10]
MRGTIIKSTGSLYYVLDEHNQQFVCKLKGNFKIKGIKSTNPIAVGDKVEFELFPEQNIGQIYKIEERQNYIIRKATKLSKQSHIIAANIDQLVLIVTLANPRTSTGFIDRFLVTAEAYHIPTSIVINKIDLYSEVVERKINDLIDIYELIGYKCYKVSAFNGIGTDTFKQLLKGKVSLLAGHSGVGKSTLIKAIEPSFNLKTKEISSSHSKGVHTTTFAEMLLLSNGGFIIDTPGIKEFGIVDFNKNDLSQRFPEMRKLMQLCQFNNCTHTHEPKCAVKIALDEGKISASRYTNYLNMLNNVETEEEEWE